MDNSILGDEASSVANSTVILDIKEGQQVSPSPTRQKTKTAEPIPYMMKSSREESVGEPDAQLLDECSVPVDPLKLPLIN